MSLLIKNGLIVTSENKYIADVYVKDEKISAISKDSDYSTDEIVDATGKYILPGAIDPHTHLCLQYMNTHAKDDYKTGTIAAACGGVTTVIDFVTQRKGESILEALERKKTLAEGNVAIDYSLHPAITDPREEVIEEIEKAIFDYGTPSFKIYMVYDFRVNDSVILQLLEKTKKYGGLVQVHAENVHMIEYLHKLFEKKGNLALCYHPKSRPNIVEQEAVARVAKLAKFTDSRIYIVHLSTKEGLYEAKKAREKGTAIFAETCPQYLVLDEEKYMESGFEPAKYTMSPPLRSKESNDALWKGIRDGSVHTIGSDHCPFDLYGIKDMFGKEDYRKIPNGAPGIETLMMLMHSEGVVKGKITLEKMVEVVSANTAKIFGLKNKGSISVGKDADIVVFDPEKKFTISCEKLHMNVDYNPYEGLDITGMPEIVYSRGKKIAIFDDDRVKFVGESGSGRFVKREPLRSLNI